MGCHCFLFVGVRGGGLGFDVVFLQLHHDSPSLRLTIVLGP